MADQFRGTAVWAARRRKTCLRFASWLTVVAALATVAIPAARAERPPNIVLILADDLGRGEYSAFGNPDVQTPHIDGLFRDGLTWENFYANSCVCSPTRAALLTGCYPDRVGVPGVIRDVRENSWGYLAPQAVLLPQLLQPAGYHTALVGKWHLGYAAPNTPLDRGCDHFHGFLGDMLDDYYEHLRNGRNFLRLGREEIQAAGHATDLFTDWASEYLRSRQGVEQPFFLYLPYTAPHDPLQPPDEYLQRVQARSPHLSEQRAKLVALIEHLDEGVGRVLAQLDALSLTDETLVIFTSDNGGLLPYGANNGPFRSGKGHVYEGGIRVPCAMRWPGRIAAGRSTPQVALSMDLFPTLLAAAGASLPAEIDGLNLLPYLQSEATAIVERDVYFVRREGGPQFAGLTIEAVRRGDWKLVHDSPTGPFELFHLGRDPQETTDLAAQEPQIVAELRTALQQHVQRAGRVAWQPPESTPTH